MLASFLGGGSNKTRAIIVRRFAASVFDTTQVILGLTLFFPVSVFFYRSFLAIVSIERKKW